MTIIFDDAREITGVDNGGRSVVEATGFTVHYSYCPRDTKPTLVPVATVVAEWAEASPWNREVLHDAMQETYLSSWTGLGAVLAPDGTFLNARVSPVHDYRSGFFGAVHLCELVRMASNARAVQRVLGWSLAAFEEADIFWYDIGDRETVEEVSRLELRLADTSILDKGDHAALEQETGLGGYCPECEEGDHVSPSR